MVEPIRARDRGDGIAFAIEDEASIPVVYDLSSLREMLAHFSLLRSLDGWVALNGSPASRMWSSALDTAPPFPTSGR